MRSGSPSSGNNDTKRARTRKLATAPPRKPTLFDDLDGTSTPQPSAKSSTAAQVKNDSDDDSSSLSSLSPTDFEDVSLAKRLNVRDEDDDESGEDDDDDDLEFEDVQTPHAGYQEAPMPGGDLELTLIKDTRISLTNAFDKKGPSKIERRIRVATHCVHVQFLLWHNAIRNSWLCDPEVKGLLLSHLPPRLWDEVERWRRNSGLDVPQEPPKEPPSVKTKGKGKGKNRNSNDRPSREWSNAAQHLERGAIDLSRGDPLLRLMKALSAWWKQRFRITAPGLRKFGYMSLERLDRLTKAYVGQEADAVRSGSALRLWENSEDAPRIALGAGMLDHSCSPPF
jgi:xeroderma pigmentosum group C-complementing protein